MPADRDRDSDRATPGRTREGNHDMRLATNL